MDELNKILRTHSVNGVFHTHVSMGNIKGKYQFNRQGLESFWDAYSKVIYEAKDPCIGVAEKSQQYLPVLGDIDIKVRETEDEDIDDFIHTDKHVRDTVEIYQSVLRKIVDGCSDDHLVCVVLEKPLYRITKNDITYAKHGFHLHFPYCFLNKMDQEIHLIPRVQSIATEQAIFKDIGFEESGKLIDNSCCKVPWLMYGSRKDNTMKPYLLSKIYNSELKEIDLEEAFEDYPLFDMSENPISCTNGTGSSKTENIRRLLPQILSIVPHNRPTAEVKNGLMLPIKGKLLKENKGKKPEYKKQSVIQALEIAKKLLPLLSDHRSRDHNEWMTIGWILFNISDGCMDALNLWCEFSVRDEEHPRGEVRCMYEWERMVQKDLSLGTLRYYASIDSPSEYTKFKKEQATVHIQDSLNGSHNDIAKALYAEYCNEFVCSSISNRSWYQFSGNKWEHIEEGVFLREKISGDFALKYVDIAKDCMTKVAVSVGNDGESAMNNVKIKQAQKMMNNVKASPYKSNCMKECAEVFYDRRFREKLDMNPMLFPFNNGVYDLTLNIFRAGRPEDFISKATPINYVEFSEDDEKVHDVYDFLEKVFPDQSIRQYFLDVSSDIFVGGNVQKQVYFWTGEGDNGKSVTQSIFEKMLGQLAIKMSTSVVTGKKVANGAANPELARAGGGVRWAILEEPNADEMINIGILKSLTGNDSYLARDLFEKGKETREITPMFKLVFITNKLPKLRYSDKATWNRIRVIPFESTFCRSDDPDPAPESYEDQLNRKRFPMDNEFYKKIPGMVEAFAWILLRHRQTIKTRVEPEKVRIATAIYRKQNDVYRQFVEESVMKDENASLSLVELYSHFKDWYKDSLPGQQVPIKNEIEEYFSRLWGDPDKGKKWNGYRIKTIQDDIDNGDVIILKNEDLTREYEDNTKFMPPL